MLKINNLQIIICVCIVFSSFTIICSDIADPYKILGVQNSASIKTIRQAYKQLAKEWHPDKNSFPDAAKKFIDIKQAYELLSDSARRRIYDQHGITNEDTQFIKKKHDYSKYERYTSDPFEEIFGNNFLFDQDINLYHKLSVTTKYFEKVIIPKSSTVPYIILYYNDWCFRCSRWVGAFKKVIDMLEPLGIQFATVNAGHEEGLVGRAGIKDIPSVTLLLNGHSYIYRETLFSSSKIVDFIRHKLPPKIGQVIDDSNINDFLNGWTDNRVRALIFEPRSQTRLRYIISAFAFHRRIAFGFVRFQHCYCENIKSRFQINTDLDSLLIFNEDSNRPTASVSMTDIPQTTLHSILTTNQYLMLPRLSSQEILEGICPAEWNRPRKRLCIILVTENRDAHNFARGALRHIALQSEYSFERVRYAYIFKEKQGEFMNAISKGSSFEDITLRIVIIWRRDSSHIKYEWVKEVNLDMKEDSSTSIDHLVNLTKKKIDRTVERLLQSSEALNYEAFVQALLDEHAEGFISKSLTKMINAFEYISDNIEQEHLLATLSLIGTIAFMFAVGYIMVYFLQAEEENLKITGKLSNNTSSKLIRSIPELKLHELRAEKYNGMVRLLKPGCRTIILITDLKARNRLIPIFHKTVWPFRKSKTLIFGHMLIEKGISWYSELLRLSICESKHFEINPRNCVGTVIAINGHRKYFCVYHAKHPETKRGEKRIVSLTKQLLQANDDVETGDFFIGNYSDESEGESAILLEENLLNGLSNWLDRLFEGTTHRYYVNYWPDFTTK